MINTHDINEQEELALKVPAPRQTWRDANGIDLGDPAFTEHIVKALQVYALPVNYDNVETVFRQIAGIMFVPSGRDRLTISFPGLDPADYRVLRATFAGNIDPHAPLDRPILDVLALAALAYALNAE